MLAFGKALEVGVYQVELDVHLSQAGTSYTHAEWQRIVTETANVIDTYGLWDDILFSSFSLEALAWAKSLCPQAAIALLDWDQKSSTDWIRLVWEMGGSGWFPHPKLATAERIAQAHDLGLLVVSGGGNDAVTRVATVQAHAAAGVDIISTNYPAEVAELLA